MPITNPDIKRPKAMPIQDKSSQEDEDVEEGNASAHSMRRQFSVWSLAALCLCLMATWEALSTVVTTALANGGAPCLFYN
jgi:choline transport protein